MHFHTGWRERTPPTHLAVAAPALQGWAQLPTLDIATQHTELCGSAILCAMSQHHSLKFGPPVTLSCHNSWRGEPGLTSQDRSCCCRVNAGWARSAVNR